MGFAPAARFFRPSRIMACASRVAVVVPSPATSLVLVETSLHELRAHVLKRILQLDLLGDGHAVVGDQRSAELLVQHDVAALGAKGDLHGIGQRIDADFQAPCGPLRRI